MTPVSNGAEWQGIGVELRESSSAYATTGLSRSIGASSAFMHSITLIE
jgi:hypothetical protein